VKIDGIDHEFSTIKGVIEDVTEIILNLKQIRFKKIVEDVDQEKVTIKIANKEVLKAGDLNDFFSSFELLNPDLVIMRMESDVKINMELSVSRGRGYVPAEEK
jgi:DNA-directed RNA polymerase subunit alpha